MIACLLCPSPAAADGLCVPCGAKKWAASYIGVLTEAALDTKVGQEARAAALRELQTPARARAFLDRLEAARRAREAAPLCKHGCMSHDGEGGRS